MNEFDSKERKQIVLRMTGLGLSDLAEEFEKDGLVRIFDTRTGKQLPLSDLDNLHIEDVKEIFGSRTYLIISAYEKRERIGKVEFFLGIDDGCNYTNFIVVEPEVGAVSAPAFYSDREFQYGIESFIFSKNPEFGSWETITSLHKSLEDEDDDDLPF